MPEDNLYTLLQVEPDAGLPEIRAAYRRLIFQHHPDRNAGVNAQEMTQQLIQAYELLSDPDRRAAYDWQISGVPGPPPGDAEQPESRPPIFVESRSQIFGGLSRTAGLAATGAVLVAAVIVIGVMIATGGGDPNNVNQTVQVVAPVATPNLTPPVSPGSGESSGGSTGITPAATPNPTFLFESGEAFIRNGDFHRAIDEFTRAIELIPSYGFGYQIRGDSYFQLAQFDMAIQDYDKAIELDPNNKSAYNGRGLARYQLGQYQLAIEDYDKAIALDDRFASAFNRRGLAYRQLERFDLAKLDIDSACSLASQFCSPLLSVVPTATPPPTETPEPVPPTEIGPPGTEFYILVSSSLSIRSTEALRRE